MRRRWPILAGTVPLVLGWTLVAAHPAAAAGGTIQPGGPLSPASVRSFLSNPAKVTGGSATGALLLVGRKARAAS